MASHQTRPPHQVRTTISPGDHVEPARGRGLTGHHGQVPVGVDQEAELALGSRSAKVSTRRSAAAGERWGNRRGADPTSTGRLARPCPVRAARPSGRRPPWPPAGCCRSGRPSTSARRQRPSVPEPAFRPRRRGDAPASGVDRVAQLLGRHPGTERPPRGSKRSRPSNVRPRRRLGRGGAARRPGRSAPRRPAPPPRPAARCRGRRRTWGRRRAASPRGTAPRAVPTPGRRRPGRRPGRGAARRAPGCGAPARTSKGGI